MAKARLLLSGAIWMYAAQIVTVIAQLGYAAVTSRLVSANNFGVYAVALSAGAIVSLLANGGMSQSVSRLRDLDQRILRSMASQALLLGSAATMALLLLAAPWAGLWGNDEAATPIRWLAISAGTAPLYALSIGLLRRRGKFRRLSSITLSGNLVGFAVGAMAVIQWPTASTLLVSMITAQLVSLLLALVANREHLGGLGRPLHAREQLTFSWKLTIASILSYLVGNIPKWSVARILGPAPLGNWNRADVITTIPFQQVQTVMISVIYPEFRHDIDNPLRAKRIWPDLLSLVAWAVLPGSVLVAVVAPTIVPILLGPKWGPVTVLVVPLALAAGLQVLSTVLASAIEAIGRFRWIWSTQFILIAVQIAAVVLIAVQREIWVAMAALLATGIVRHGWHLWLCGRHGYIDVRQLLKSYLQVAVACVGLGAISLAFVALVGHADTSPWLWALASALIVAAALALAKYGKLLPPFKIVQRYDLFSKNRAVE